MPQARAVGRVKPRSAAEDWFAVGFDPWSAGREPLSAEFIPTLSIKQVESAVHRKQKVLYCFVSLICFRWATYISLLVSYNCCCQVAPIPQFRSMCACFWRVEIQPMSTNWDVFCFAAWYKGMEYFGIFFHVGAFTLYVFLYLIARRHASLHLWASRKT